MKTLLALFLTAFTLPLAHAEEPEAPKLYACEARIHGNFSPFRMNMTLTREAWDVKLEAELRYGSSAVNSQTSCKWETSFYSARDGYYPIADIDVLLISRCDRLSDESGNGPEDIVFGFRYAGPLYGLDANTRHIFFLHQNNHQNLVECKEVETFEALPTYYVTE